MQTNIFTMFLVAAATCQCPSVLAIRVGRLSVTSTHHGTSSLTRRSVGRGGMLRQRGMYLSNRRFDRLRTFASNPVSNSSEGLVETEDIITDITPLIVVDGAISPPNTQPPKAGGSTKKQLEEELRQYRHQQSSPLQKPAYSVFTNAAMEEICMRLPTTEEEILEVKGIGPKKLQTFGDDILEIVSRYMESGGSSNAAAAPRRDVSVLRAATTTIIDPASLSEEQLHAASLPLDTNKRSNVFITGAAGTGKSHVLKYILQELQKQKRRFGVCAPTGVAAINVGGSTLHSYFGIGLGTGSFGNLIKKVLKNTEAMKRIDNTDVLCIDECSMLSSDLLETLDAVAREVRLEGSKKEEPFGGMQIIAVGDFFQLPPIEQGGGDFNGWRPFCFDSHVWADLNLMQNTFELKEIQRQGKRTKFAQFLNMVRTGDVTPDIIRDFNAKCLISESHPLPTDGIVPTRLYVLNKDVDAENEYRLADLKGEMIVCKARDEWREKMPTGTLAKVKQTMKQSISKEMPDEVNLKVGAQVMLTRNKDLERSLVNGSRGIVERFIKDADGDQIPIVRFDCGVVEKVGMAEAIRYNPDGGGRQPGCLVRKQIPLKLAWALTVHKSQGTTLSRALLDISSAFEQGQAYVSLSRVRTIGGLWLERPVRFSNIMVSPQVIAYYNNIIS